MKIIHLKRTIIVGILITLLLPSLMQAQTLRGSIISVDNQTLAFSDTYGTRMRPFIDSCSPILGYTNLDTFGRKGIEKYYNKYLSEDKDLHLNINLALQKKIETMLGEKREVYDADEILIGVMESQTGKVLALASSNRYDPSHITEKDISALNPKFAQYPYEPGSVMKPLSIAVALEHGVITPETWFDTKNGRLEPDDNHTITDDEKFKNLTVTDIIVHSSNVGSSLISWKLTGKEFRDGLLKFGFTKPSGMDQSRDLSGIVKDEKMLDNKIHRANNSYGYGMLATFSQLMKAYSAFNNDGIAVTPKLMDYFEDSKGNHFSLASKAKDLHPIGKKVAHQMHNILLEVVKRGTGTKAQYPGLEIGGKTGTAYIAKNGKYVREYHSSFYGFANDDEGHRYTIGVLVVRAKVKYKYFASQSAVPVFREVVDALMQESYLVVGRQKVDVTTVEGGYQGL